MKFKKVTIIKGTRGKMGLAPDSENVRSGAGFEFRLTREGKEAMGIKLANSHFINHEPQDEVTEELAEQIRTLLSSDYAKLPGFLKSAARFTVRYSYYNEKTGYFRKIKDPAHFESPEDITKEALIFLKQGS